MLARPSEIEITAPLRDVKGAIVDEMTGAKWQLDKDSDFQLAFSQIASSGEAFGLMLGAQISGEDPSMASVNSYITLVPRNGSTLVRFRFDMSYSTRGGRTLRQDNLGERKHKPELLQMLDILKIRLEARASVGTSVSQQ